ncbi:MAG: orotidine-5'-phosphate decarboxylase [Polyangiaceae bacterium]|nr:orotidine-5'-phosphate decarboxylase [Polyangiaceae bacterium]
MNAANFDEARRRLVYPLDYPTLEEARAGAELIAEHVGVLKVGLELFVRVGPAALALGRQLGCEVFLDLKLHDIPATVDGAVASAISHGVRYLTVHATGGQKMLEAAADRVEKEQSHLALLAVTVLTSLDESDLRATGVSFPPNEQALRLAVLARKSGIRGMVSSVAEVSMLRSELGPDVVLVTPGIRPAGAGTQDQKRVGTPAQAMAAGSSLLVVGRPIREASDPRAAAEAIRREVAEALA